MQERGTDITADIRDERAEFGICDFQVPLSVFGKNLWAIGYEGLPGSPTWMAGCGLNEQQFEDNVETHWVACIILHKCMW